MLSHVGSLYQLPGVGQFASFVVVNATAWFVFIAGYLFHYIEHKRFEFFGYLLKKARYVILPYLMLSVPAIGAGLYLGRDELFGLSPLSYSLWSLVVGGSVIGPMWFIPMITLFFILSWLFYRLAKTSFIYPLTIAALVASLFSSRPIGDLNPVLSFIHFLGFYLLGICAALRSNVTDRINKGYGGWLLVFAGLLIFIAAAWLQGDDLVYSTGFEDGWGRFNLVRLGKLSLLVSVFFVFELCLKTRNKILGYLAEISFGLFFIHGFFMFVFAKLSEYAELRNLFGIFLFEFFFTVLGSMLAVFLIKSVLGKKSRYVIGC
jgi:hypothetical protein